MNILVVNCGSSSVKAEVINASTGHRLLTMTIERILDAQPHLFFDNVKEPLLCPEAGHQKVMEFAFPKLLEKVGPESLKGVGHRVVHGGDIFDDPELITPEVEQKIEELTSLAPLHNPINLTGIRIAKKFLPDLVHVAIFDTAFHFTMPNRARKYALPEALTSKHKIQRYGFHGTSHQFVAQRAAEYLQSDIRDLRLITCHLGNGASACAIEYGQSIETSMGMTPLEGLVMGTRSGDVDAGILTYLIEKEKMNGEQISNLLNKESGLKGLAGVSDMRDIEEKAAKGDENARLAIEVFAHRLRKYIGAYAAVLGGADAIIFTGGIGENSASLRHRVVQRLNFMGAVLDEDKNREIRVKEEQPVSDISAPNSRCKILVIKTDEQYSIAQQTAKIVNEQNKVKQTLTIPIAVSARHVHLTQESVEALFGSGYQLTHYKDLSQPGQFAANEMVTLVGPKNRIEKVRILGPVRSKDQVEISRTDEFFLGIDAPVRESGHTENSPGITLLGPNDTKLELKEGVICAWRHIHMHPEDAEHFGVHDKDIVEVKIRNEERSLTFGNVLIRVSDKYKLEMHIDTDEANAAELNQGAEGVLLSAGAEGLLTRKKTH